MLLDTNALIWWRMGSSRLGPKALRALDKAPALYFSSVSILELEIKRMKQSVPVSFDFYQDLLESGFQEIRLSGEAAQGLRDYPSLVNHDPFDRALLASAAIFGVPFITSDSKILDLQLPFVIDACD